MYEINMSQGQKIKIDNEDLEHIQKNMKSSLIRVKQGIINPSFIVSIIPTNEQEMKQNRHVIFNKNGNPILIEEKDQIRTLENKIVIKNIKKLQ